MDQFSLPTLGAALGGAIVALFVLVSLRGRRITIRRVGTVVNRLEERPTEIGSRGGSLESALSRLERTAERANERLADEKAQIDRLVAALDALDDGVVIATGVGRVVYRNAAAQVYSEARHTDALVEEVIRTLLDGAIRGHEGRRDLQVHGPPRRSLTISAQPLGGGGVAGAVAVVTDVSTMRLADSVRRDFVANVSHELRTPIGALVALAETLEIDDDPAVMRRLATRVRHEADRLARIVDDLLDLTLLEAQQARDREQVGVSDLVTAALDRVAGGAERAGIVVEAGDVDPTLTVACDRRHVISALFNLLDNAVKYSEPVEGAGPVRIDVSVSGGEVTFNVVDHGIGIPERDRERIFERFYRVDRARSRASGGTGLGLAIVRHVAQAHGGRVSVTSQEGEGSRFEFSLPLAGGGPRAVEDADALPDQDGEP